MGSSRLASVESRVQHAYPTLVEAGEGVTLLLSGLQHNRFSDLSFCPLIDPASIRSWRGLQNAKEKDTSLFLISCAARKNSSEAQSKSDSAFMDLVPRQTALDKPTPVNTETMFSCWKTAQPSLDCSQFSQWPPA
jgi:hypothetical protein